MPDKARYSLIKASRGEIPADVVYDNAQVYNPFTCEWAISSFAVKSGFIVGTGDYRARKAVDLKGGRVVPGLIDAHVHIESSLLVPSEYARLVSAHGTTTVVADPHEIANVCGADGISFMLSERKGLPIDIFFMLPSCVPATPLDKGGAELSAKDLVRFIGEEGILGLAEVMNVPGVLNLDPAVWEKLSISSIIDGHAPLLSGKDLNAYVAAGIQSDHECVSAEEAAEKLALGMYIFAREGSTEKNLSELVQIVTPCNCNRFCFATDDRHVDMLVRDGHIDDCIRKAIESGLEPELAIRMATLSASERFLLNDRGAIAPGRIADFCLLKEGAPFEVEKVFKRGVLVQDLPARPASCIHHTVKCRPPGPDALEIRGSGKARVVGIVPHQILTESLEFEIDGRDVPDLERDILKAVVCCRYHDGIVGCGLVHGFGLRMGAIASSISHDSHNIVAVGVDDVDIRRAVAEIIRNDGGMVAVHGEDIVLLPLTCAGLMSELPFEKVYENISTLNSRVLQWGAIRDPFMYLSFLALTVIPHLRICDRGLFDVDSFSDVPLFLT
jgi:adenine deaminase